MLGWGYATLVGKGCQIIALNNGVLHGFRVLKNGSASSNNAAATIGSKAISAMLPDQAVVLSFSNGVWISQAYLICLQEERKPT